MPAHAIAHPLMLVCITIRHQLHAALPAAESRKTPPVYARTVGELLPGGSGGSDDKGRPWTAPLLAARIWSFAGQAGIKYVLTQGERIVFSLYLALSEAEEGAFGLVSNLGSLVVRFLFQHVERTCRTLFSKLLAPLQDEVALPILFYFWLAGSCVALVSSFLPPGWVEGCPSCFAPRSRPMLSFPSVFRCV